MRWRCDDWDPDSRFWEESWFQDFQGLSLTNKHGAHSSLNPWASDFLPRAVSGGVPAASSSDFNQEMLEIYSQVTATGQYNHTGARIRVPSGLNLDAWSLYLEGYSDPLLLDFLSFGWPANFSADSPLVPTFSNHPSGTAFPQHIQRYIDIEVGHQALLGPFTALPFDGIQLSPLLTRPKKDSDWRRIVMDLSWPLGGSVNDGIPRFQYVYGPATVNLPNVETMIRRVREVGMPCLLYKTDLARGYRQLRLDPWDWPLMGFSHNQQYFLDICPPFGLRTASWMMQSTNVAVTNFHRRAGFHSAVYIDDLGGAEQQDSKAWWAFYTLHFLLCQVGLIQAPGKVCYPFPSMIWLGINIDTINNLMSIPQAKMAELVQHLGDWGNRQFTTRKQLQSLLGSLNFVANVAPHTRVFTNRLLALLRGMPEGELVPISEEAQKDIRFFGTLLPVFNGMAIIEKPHLTPHLDLHLDACLSGCGGIMGDQFYSAQFPEFIMQCGHHISRLELLNIVVAAKIWGPTWAGHKVHVFCDNLAACTVLINGITEDPFMAWCLREIFFEATVRDFTLLPTHMPGAELVQADALSRAHLSPKFRVMIDQLEREGATRLEVDSRYFIVRSDL